MNLLFYLHTTKLNIKLLNTKNTLLSQARRLTLVLISNQITKSCNTPPLRHMATVRIVLPHNRQTAQSPKAGRYFLCYIDGLRKNIYTIQGDIISAHPRPVILCDVLFPDFITFFRHHIVRNDNQIVGKYIWVT